MAEMIFPPGRLPTPPPCHRPGGKRLTDLPVEVIALVMSHLDQYETVSMARCCRFTATIARSRLYHTVIVDPSYSQFDNSEELGFRNTFINTGHSLSKFFKSGHPEMVRRMLVTLPLEFNVWANHDIILDFFTRSDRLVEVQWLGEGFSPEFSMVLANVTSLEVSCKQLEVPPVKLTNFRIQPFNNTHHLREIFDRVDLSQCQSLWLCKQNTLDPGTLLPNVEELILGIDAPSIVSKLYDINLDTVASLPYLPQLTSLSLEDIVVSSDDATRIMPLLPQLRTLRLLAVSEYTSGNSKSFLLQIAGNLVNLEQLALDFRQPLVDSVPEFLLQINQWQRIKALDIVVRTNTTKVTQFCQYVLPPTITKLSIEVKQELSAADATSFQVTLSMPAPLVAAVEQLDLDVLRSNYTPNLAKFPSLRILDIFGTSTPGLALFDMRFELQHRMSAYFAAQSSLEYIRVNNEVFKEGNSRHGLGKWLDGKVRV